MYDLDVATLLEMDDDQEPTIDDDDMFDFDLLKNRFKALSQRDFFVCEGDIFRLRIRFGL